jgi:ACS family tartrate transporter-like MFS transporter
VVEADLEARPENSKLSEEDRMETPTLVSASLPVASAVTDAVAERARRRVTRRLLPYLLLLYLIAYIDRTNVGVAKLQMQGDLRFTDAIIGFGAGIFFLGYFLLEIPGTLIVERWSARKWIARIMISWGVVATLMGFIGMGPLNAFSTTQQFYWLRFILGLAEAGFFPGVLVYLSHWFRYEDRARAKAKFVVGIPISTVVGVPLSRAILENVHWFGLAGWRWVYILEGLPAILFGIITIFYLTDRPHEAKWLPEDEKRMAHRRAGARTCAESGGWASQLVGGLQTPANNSARLHLYLRSHRRLRAGLLSALDCAEHERPVGVWQTVVTMLPYICAATAILVLGQTSDRLRERRWHTAVPILLAGVGMATSVLSGDFLALTIAALCLAGLYTGAYPAFWSLPTAF